MSCNRPLVLLVQLPIPLPGHEPVRGNIPLAAGYLKLFARRQGLENRYVIDILPMPLANTLGDQGLIEEILGREPWMVGFTCYLWNVDRTLWLAERLKQCRPEMHIVLGGPEITADNAYVLGRSAVDCAVIGEGEQTFAELLRVLDGRAATGAPEAVSIDGLWQRGRWQVRPRRPLETLDEIGSPYLEGILNVADEGAMYLESVRGCAFRCKFCYYPRGYDAICYLSSESLLAVLRHAAQHGANEVVLLDPTLNQRKDFAEFVGLLGRGNTGGRMGFFGELRAEAIAPPTARLMADANFTEVEVGLQTTNQKAQTLMQRHNDLEAFERGVRAMLDAGIRVKVDLIVGLPGDTAQSVRRSIDYLHKNRLYSTVQVFNLSILPGTAFRREADRLGLHYQRVPPYFVLHTPTLALDEMYSLVEEAQDAFGIEYDPCSSPVLDFPAETPGPVCCARIDLDAGSWSLPCASKRAQAFTLWLRSGDFRARQDSANFLLRQLLDDNPHTTLQVVLEPTARPESLNAAVLEGLLATCYQTTSYLDRFYSMHPDELRGAKRLIVVVREAERGRLGRRWAQAVGNYATLMWLPEHSRTIGGKMFAHPYSA